MSKDMTTEQIKQEITVKLMSDNQEMIADCLQPLLDIAEGKKDIEEWNKFATTLIEKVDRIEAQTRRQTLEEFGVCEYCGCNGYHDNNGCGNPNKHGIQEEENKS